MIVNRPIRFRFFDKGEFEMEECVQIDLPNWTIPDAEDPSGYIAMQFTGLADSKGVDIYEGDILTEDFNAEVLFKNGAFIVQNKTNKHVKGLLYDFVKQRIKACGSCEIISHVFNT